MNDKFKEVSPIGLASGEVTRLVSCGYQIVVMQAAAPVQVHNLGYTTCELATKVLDNTVELLNEKSIPYEIKLEKLEVIQHKIGGITVN